MSYAMENPGSSLLENDENRTYSIPTWDDLRNIYDAKWMEEKEKFHNQLKDNFRGLVSQYKSGQKKFLSCRWEPIRSITNSHKNAFWQYICHTG